MGSLACYVHVGSVQCAVYSRISITALEHVCGALSVQSRNHLMHELFLKNGGLTLIQVKNGVEKYLMKSKDRAGTK